MSSHCHCFYICLPPDTKKSPAIASALTSCEWSCPPTLVVLGAQFFFIPALSLSANSNLAMIGWIPDENAVVSSEVTHTAWTSALWLPKLYMHYDVKKQPQLIENVIWIKFWFKFLLYSSFIYSKYTMLMLSPIWIDNIQNIRKKCCAFFVQFTLRNFEFFVQINSFAT